MKPSVGVVTLVLVAAACGQGLDEEAAGVTTTGPAPTTTITIPAGPDVTATASSLVVWAEPETVPTVIAAANEFTTALGIEVVIEAVELEDVESRLASSRGPDLFSGSHTWLGRLAPRRLASPLGIEGRLAEFEPIAVEAFTYQGQVFGAPYGLETVVLLHNSDLSPGAPGSFSEIKTLCSDIRGEEASDETTTTSEGSTTTTLSSPDDGFACVVGMSGNTLATMAFLTAPGGYLYGANEDGTPNPADIGLDSDAALVGATFLRELITDGVIEPADDVAALAQSMASGEAVFALGGLEAAEALQEVGAGFGVAPLPFMAGHSPMPYVEAFGFMIAGRSSQRETAALFLTDYLMSSPVLDALAASVGRTSAYVGTAEAPPATGFLASAREGVPLPPGADIELDLQLMGDGLSALYRGETAVDEILTALADSIRSRSGG